MELAIKRNRMKVITIISILMCLIPTMIVFASALTQPLVGMNGVGNSGLTVGRTGSNNSNLTLDKGSTGGHVNPSQYPIFTFIPILLFLVSVLVIIIFALSETKDIRILVYAGIIIIFFFLLFSLVQSNINSLLGV